MGKLLLLVPLADEKKEYDDIELSSLKIWALELLALEPFLYRLRLYHLGKKIKHFPLKHFKSPIFTLMHKQLVFYLKILWKKSFKLFYKLEWNYYSKLSNFINWTVLTMQVIILKLCKQVNSYFVLLPSQTLLWVTHAEENIYALPNIFYLREITWISKFGPGE